jgi:hypothetical protein
MLYKVFGFGWIREDTFAKKVYLRDFQNDSEIVLLDYNLNVGDSFVIQYSTAPPYKYTVHSIDSTLINMTWHRVWHFTRGSFGFWCDIIEGIGCIQDPRYMLQGVHIGGEACWYMYCFSNKGINPPVSPKIEFFDNSTSCAEFPTIKASQIAKKEMSIYPNPAHDEISIDCPDGVNSMTIRNAIGTIVYQSNNNSNKAVFDISRLCEGIYFVVANNRYIYKFEKSGQ